MDGRLLIAGAALALMIVYPDFCQAQDTIASPAIDPTIFKDGAVKAKEFQFDAWYARCQEIIKIKKRVCNLLSSLRDSSNIEAGSVIIATTDTGIPALMIASPIAVGPNRTMRLESSHLSKIGGKVVKVEYKENSKPMVCDPRCKYMLPLDSRLVFTLNSGEDLKVSFVDPKNEAAQSKKPTSSHVSFENYLVSGSGFSATLSATTGEW